MYKKHNSIDSKGGYKKMSPSIYSLLRRSFIILDCDELAMLSSPSLPAIAIGEVSPTAKEIVEQERTIPGWLPTNVNKVDFLFTRMYLFAFAVKGSCQRVWLKVFAFSNSAWPLMEKFM